MARNVANSVENNFTRGLITEASGLNFPENACTDTDNCHFELTGRVRRRNAIDLETSYTTKTIDRTDCAISTYLWRNVAGNGDTTLYVVQVGDTLYFYDVTESIAISQGALAGTISLADFQPSGALDTKPVECQYADGNGTLFVTHPYVEAIYVTYDLDTKAIEGHQIDILARDFTGDTSDPQTRTDETRLTSTLAALDKHHYYNLLNQGWTSTNLTAWDTARADVPNNIDVMWTFKNSSETFDTSLVDKIVRGNTPAPNGHFIMSVFDQDRDTASGLSGTTRTTTGTNRLSTCAFHAGRVFYAGIQSQGYSGNIYFSQVIAPGSRAEFGLCYQVQDPTSEALFDLLPDDGGVIGIPDSGTIIKLWATQAGLVVFGTNGVWLITGSTGIGFTATDYTVRNIARVRTISASSFVDVAGYPAWWAAEGIYILVPDNSAGIAVKSLTDTSILTWYMDIPLICKKTARGSFNLITKKVQWIYRSTESGTPDEQHEFDKVLIYNVLTNAFNPWTFTASDISVHGIVTVDNSGGFQRQVDVIDDSSNTVVDDDGNTVTTFTLSTVVTPRFKYLVSYPSGGSYAFTFAEETLEGYYDWISYDGVGMDYDSYVVSGYKVHGQAVRKFEANYIFIYSQSLPVAYYFQTLRDYANAAGTGKWSTRQQTVALASDDYTIKVNRLKTRGQGKVLQFKISSVPGENFDIVGWATFETANASI